VLVDKAADLAGSECMKCAVVAVDRLQVRIATLGDGDGCDLPPTPARARSPA